VLGDQTYPYYPEPTSSVSSLPGQTTTNCLGSYCIPPQYILGHWIGVENTLYPSTFPIYIHQTWQWTQMPSDWAAPNESVQVQLLEQSIAEGVPALLAMGPPSIGHAVVAWGYTLSPDGNLTIDLSDPNHGTSPRTAYYSGGQFSYVDGSYRWDTFAVVSPGIMQPSWFSLQGDWPSRWNATVDQTNPYYNFVFSDGPITIFSQPGSASFSALGDSLTFTNDIQGVVGFEEGSMQAYAIPKGIGFSIGDPSRTSSFLTVVIPQNTTSIVGYQISTTSGSPLNITITPSNSTLKIVSSTDIQSSVSFFAVGHQGHSLLTATSMPLSSSQTALFSVPDWTKLNSTQSAPTLQLFEPSSTAPMASYTLANNQQGLSQPSGMTSIMLPLVTIVSALFVCGIAIFLYAKRRKRS